MNFMTGLKNELVNGESNVSVTENGGLGYRTTGKALLDMNYAVSSLRNCPDGKIEAMFAAALAEDADLAVVWLFFSRHCRGGMGERRLFRVCFRYLAREFPAKAVKVLRLIPEYGRWDDLIDFFFDFTDENPAKAAFEIISNQLGVDMHALRDGKRVSLLAKWLPSENASSAETRRRARKLALMLGIPPKAYRRILSSLRRRIDVVERRMSSGDWAGIDYESVPSKANLIYRDAFMKHDPDRRKLFLSSLKDSPDKINASVLFPHEIVRAYMDNRWTIRDRVDPTLEALWKNLPNVFPEAPEILVVADGSGSMTCGGGDLVPLDVANALAIYFSERLAEPFRDKYITFSHSPRYVDLSGATTLLGKLQTALEHDECANTDIGATFGLILSTAVNHRLSQDDLPGTILVITDGEFDEMADGADERIFDMIRDEFAEHGYKLPKLAFWNVCSRTMTIPVRENELGVALISGFSPSVIRMVMSGKLDPYEAMIDVLNDPAYDAVREALK